MNKLKRYLLFLAGLLVNALGVSLVTKASLGTSPISSIPYILRDNKRVLKVFFNAPLESRIKRVMKRQGVEYSEAQHRIRKTDKYRADNYRYYTGRIWGASSNFDLTINTDFGIEKRDA